MSRIPLSYKVPLIILLILFFCLGVDKAMACGPDKNDLKEINLKDYYLCMGGQNWCKRIK